MGLFLLLAINFIFNENLFLQIVLLVQSMENRCLHSGREIEPNLNI